ncbi:hypothetical protein [Cryobacterium zongtaii]|uniref:hypothetical protein n=1 Tax=Cryobacterium zongtaii TaxID=1259217 RepID=UPI0010573067|nr:hypothetical protein [Cryobacterium zongtaii]
MSEIQRPTEWDELVLATIGKAITLAGADDVTDVTFEYKEDAAAWMTSVEPHRPGAASIYVIAEGENELNLTVGQTWLEVWGVDDPVEWVREMTDAVVAGSLEEAGSSRIRIHSRIGVLGGGDALMLPWRWHRNRTYAPYLQP